MEPGNKRIQDSKCSAGQEDRLNNNTPQSKHPTGNVKIVSNRSENPHKLNCMMFNADSLTNKIPEFELLVKTKMPHIIGINEALPKNFKRKIYEQEFILNEYEMVSIQILQQIRGEDLFFIFINP